jgi:hypothetical protein
MTARTYILPESERAEMVSRLTRELLTTLPGRKVRVTVEKYVRRRSLEQNAYLWGVVYPKILKECGESAKWRAEDLHEMFLGEWSGWEEFEIFGKKRRRPIHRSHNLTTVDFADFVTSIQHFAAEHGVDIPDPNEVET